MALRVALHLPFEFLLCAMQVLQLRAHCGQPLELRLRLVLRLLKVVALALRRKHPKRLRFDLLGLLGRKPFLNRLLGRLREPSVGPLVGGLRRMVPLIFQRGDHLVWNLLLKSCDNLLQDPALLPELGDDLGARLIHPGMQLGVHCSIRRLHFHGADLALLVCPSGALRFTVVLVRDHEAEAVNRLLSGNRVSSAAGRVGELVLRDSQQLPQPTVPSHRILDQSVRFLPLRVCA
mmetsp:Transcript_71068/g.205794  ORF Transcript_71068/g.205794 Transcript_71068/m.205794 type:complete len:234 (+) Transcript_71068:38-739(+)